MKKLLSTILIVSLTLGLMACGSTSSTTTSGAETTTAANAQNAQTASSQTGSKKSGFKIGFANGYFGNTWRAQMVSDFEVLAEKYKSEGVISEYIVANTNSDVTEQNNQLNAMIDSGVDALMIVAVSPTSIKPAVDAALKKGILVVITNDPAAYEGTIAVCGNNYSWQKIQALWLAEQLSGKGDIVEITGEPGNAADIVRQNANKDIFKNYPDIKVLTSVPGKWSQTEAQSVMSTVLSSYNKIDAVLAQDVMAEGIIKAYETAKRELPIMTGDYTKTFLQKWNELDSLNSIAVPYAPGISATALEVTIQLLQGKKIKDSALQGNPMDQKLVNCILVDPPYVVTKEGDSTAKWMEGLVGTKAITLTEAVELMKDKPDTAALDGWLTAEEVSTFFE